MYRVGFALGKYCVYVCNVYAQVHGDCTKPHIHNFRTTRIKVVENTLDAHCPREVCGIRHNGLCQNLQAQLVPILVRSPDVFVIVVHVAAGRVSVVLLRGTFDKMQGYHLRGVSNSGKIFGVVAFVPVIASPKQTTLVWVLFYRV